MSASVLCSSTSRVEANWPCISEYCEWAEPSSAPLDLIIIISHLLHNSLMRHIARFWQSLLLYVLFFFFPCCLPTSYHFYVSFSHFISFFPCLSFMLLHLFLLLPVNMPGRSLPALLYTILVLDCGSASAVESVHSEFSSSVTLIIISAKQNISIELV